MLHVYKLKEGWDVNNLFTIIPLNAAKSDILALQTIGRGLRLPFGEITGIEELDTWILLLTTIIEKLLMISRIILYLRKEILMRKIYQTQKRLW